MAKSFDTQFRELVLAVALCDVESVKRILSSKWYEKNTVKIMRKGRDVGCIEVPLSIHNIAHCWEIILNLDTMSEDFLSAYNGSIEKLCENNKAILEILSHKFNGASDKMIFNDYTICIPYGASDYDDVIMQDLKECNLRQIDEELEIALYAYDLERFEELIRYGANPWADLVDDDCVWEQIEWRGAHMANYLLKDVLTPQTKRDLPQLLEDIICMAGYESFYNLLEEYVPYDSEVKCTQIKTIPRIIYSSRPALSCHEVGFEISYDPDTEKTEFRHLDGWHNESETLVPEKVIRSLLSSESIESFMNIELQPTEHDSLDGTTYMLKMIDSDGNIKEIWCDSSNMDQVPHIVQLEKYNNIIRKRLCC